MATNNSVIDDKLHWYKDAIIYELHIKAFRDSNGDGIGDFQGLLDKLDYLQDLGITAIWVLPFYPSPLKDDGYDIADYYSINNSYGTLDQFKAFLAEAHKRNLKVITELVINHTSDQHPWFQRARSAHKGSIEREFYVWSDDPTQYKDVRIIFQDFEASNWTWDPVAQQYYWHRFFHHQPDLNYDNPIVQEEIFKIMDYWCSMGVDGFRLDAVPYLFEREGTNGENLPETHAFLKKLRHHVDTHYPGTVFLAEANMWPEDSASYFGDGDECHMNYHFPVMPRMFMAMQQEDRYPITDIFDQTPPIPPTCQWAIFLRNHDELTLEMVTDEERDFMYKVYAKDPKAKINLGIRHRLAPLMDNSLRKIELMNSLLFSLPGTPVIYYGDEIGMGDNFYLGDRDGVRTPMQWSADRNAGFSEANPQSLYLPVILDPEYSYESVNVEMQRRNTSSLFWFMKRIINMRKNHKAFGRGDMQFLHVENPKVLAFTRTYQDETLLIVANLAKYAQPAEIDLKAFKGNIPVEAFSKNQFPAIKENTPYFFTLSPHSFQWFILQKAYAQTEDKKTLPTIQADSLESVFESRNLKELTEIVLPTFLQKRSWFKGKNRTIYSITISHKTSIPLVEAQAILLILEVAYESGLPENYQLAVTICEGVDARKLVEETPEAVLAFLRPDGEFTVLCDAFYFPFYQQFLINSLAEGKQLTTTTGKLNFKITTRLAFRPEESTHVKSKIHTVDENNTSITYNQSFFLKMYREVDKSINPDVETTSYLSTRNLFEHIPKYLGAIEWQLEKEVIVLGMVQELIENHGTGYSYMLERINNYIERILARDRNFLNPAERYGSLIEPLSFEELPEHLQVLLGNRAADFAKLLGERTGEMHVALAAIPNTDFQPEEFSLHYQRSLFSAMQSLVRESFQSLQKHFDDLPIDVKQEANEMFHSKDHLLNMLKRIYAKKLNVVKVRHHGNFHLDKVLLTGKDLVIQDFGGDPMRSFSERRIKRSPLRDVADMVCSFYYVAYEGFFTNPHVTAEERAGLLPFARLWAYYMSSFFIKAYLNKVKGSSFVPKDKQDLRILGQTLLLQKALYRFNIELNNRPDRVIIPLHLIAAIIKETKELKSSNSMTNTMQAGT
ncbi:maltose alpha-D-glucosyltransferase [Flavisolibacter tropicus]|uniref:maltose alpha-D-glucosyltransferase n=1 Tax=Flavisolibacter tropicus TaxID=1492898 RepID=A0A172TRA3_9BACT|nr:maltose alpha-D-glucosyltransferase [Flavisolibacter tropicus]ANE49293.1 alpha-amylase [Flavisolibacter tropicus]